MNDLLGKKQCILYNTVQIAYYFLPNNGKETIFLLHPAFADAEIFEAQIEAFCDDYQLLLMDFPGHGNSEAKGTKATTADVPLIMKMILDEVGVNRCHVVGVSLGSLIAQAFAARYAGKTISVAIIGGYSIHKANDKILRAQGQNIVIFALYLIFSMKKFRRFIINETGGGDRFREVFGRGIQKFRRSSFPAMSNMNDLFEKKDTPVSYPFLIVCGEQDRELARDAAAVLHDLEPDSRYALIPDAGHCANIDNPEVFNSILRTFLRETCRYSRSISQER